jgi:hypothetical protein
MFSPKTQLATYGRKNYRTSNWNVLTPGLPKTWVFNPNYSGGGAYSEARVSKGTMPIQKSFQAQMEERRKKR